MYYPKRREEASNSMKTIIQFVILIFWCSLSYGQQEQDSIAIINVLKTEAATWRSGDIEAHANCWQLRPYSKILISTGSGKIVDIDPNLIVNPPPSMVGTGGYAELSNFTMSILGDSAWVSHDELSVAPNGEKSLSKEIRLLEKVEGEWKLVGQSIHVDGEYEE